ncbi:MAG: hypothetical protein ABSG53_34250 [Thermoguttaceae bacterium]|jgi:hypothetical protein
MSLEIKQNILGGQSLWISPRADLSDVPSPYRELLRDEHRHAFTNAAAYFGQLAETCELDGMKQWLAEIAKSGRCGLQVHMADMFGSHQEDVLVRGFLPSGPEEFTDFRIQTFMGGSPRISDPLDSESEMLVRSFGQQDVASLPDPLRMMYELIDGTVDSGFGEAGGINSIGDLYYRYVAGGLPIEEGTPPELLESPIFYGNPCGDTLVACGGKAYWYLHEICGFREAGELFAVVSGYFHAILDGREWLGDPYANL